MKNNELIITGNNLTLLDVEAVARRKRRVALSDQASQRISNAKDLVNKIAGSNKAVYGISTGFGELSTVHISEDKNLCLQRNLILSHACGMGNPLPEDIVRAIMLLRLNTMAKGFSGVSPSVTALLTEFLNRNIIPYIPEQGSLGASGDLANLAHMALVLIGEGKAWYEEELLPGQEILTRAGLEAVVLSGKDGLAIINGTQIMAGIGALALYDAKDLYFAANLAAALTFEALRGMTSAYDKRIQQARPHSGQIETANFLLKALQGSEYVDSRPDAVQDPYTLRCVPQVHGAVIDALAYVERVLETEFNSVTDNPLIFVETGEVISGGNFHGEPLALALDFLGIAAAELANMSERRIERLVNPQLNYGLPAFLVKNGGVNSGLMIPQYVAASIVSENKVLAHPASVDSIPSSANKEDHVSMGAIAARKAKQIVDNVRRVLAIEFLAAAQALDVQAKKKLGQATSELYDRIRERVPTLKKDRVLSDNMNELEDMLSDPVFYQDMRQVLRETD
ncbi:MAG: histidine ammonia-lyase [Saccharofermentanales bacterium]|jgi:histidine ammonia-lyase